MCKVRILSRQIVIDEALAVRRPYRRAQRVTGLLDEEAEVGPIGVDDIDTEALRMLPAHAVTMARPVSVAVRSEGNPLPVWGP